MLERFLFFWGGEELYHRQIGFVISCCKSTTKVLIVQMDVRMKSIFVATSIALVLVLVLVQERSIGSELSI